MRDTTIDRLVRRLHAHRARLWLTVLGRDPFSGLADDAYIFGLMRRARRQLDYAREEHGA